MPGTYGTTDRDKVADALSDAIRVAFDDEDYDLVAALAALLDARKDGK